MDRCMSIIVIILMLFPAGSSAQSLEVSGSYRGEFEMLEQDSSYRHQQWMNLQFDRSFGMKASMRMNLEFNTYDYDRTRPFFREAYVNYYTSNIDWRFGKQIISWGSAYKIKPTDYFNPYDFTTLMPGDRRTGITAVSAILYGPARTEVSGVVTPFFNEHLLEPQTENKLFNLNLDQTVRTLDQNIPYFSVRLDSANRYYHHEPEANLSNTQGGLKLTKRGLVGVDISISGYHGRDKLVAIDERKTSGSVSYVPGTPPQVDSLATVYFFYPQVNRYGLDMIGSAGGVGLWLELVQNQYHKDQFNDNLSIVAGADYKFSSDLYLVMQGMVIEARDATLDDVQALMLHLTRPVFNFHEIELTGMYDFQNDSYLVQPQLNFSFADAVTLGFGGTLLDMSGHPYRPLMTELIADRIYTRLSVDF